MEFKDIAFGRVPKLHRLKQPSDVDCIEFVDGLAEVEVPIELLDHVPIKNYERNDSPRLQAVIRAIRNEGYSSIKPIVARVGALGNWVVIDGGHRITAAKIVSREFFTNLWGQKVGDLTFILFQTPMSYSKLRPKQHTGMIGPESRPQARKIGRAKPSSDESSDG